MFRQRLAVWCREISNHQYWTPANRWLPSLLWVRIRADIASYLVNREAENAQVTYWYHRQFVYIVKQESVVIKGIRQLGVQFVLINHQILKTKI